MPVIPVIVAMAVNIDIDISIDVSIRAIDIAIAPGAWPCPIRRSIGHSIPHTTGLSIDLVAWS